MKDLALPGRSCGHGTTGTLQIRFASEVGGSNAVIKAGSNLVAIKVA